MNARFAPGVPVARTPADVTPAWLAAALGRRVLAFERREAASVWATHVLVTARVEDEPAPLALRVKLGSARVFGRAEVDYYGCNFADLPDAPLVRCHHAAADDTAYHLLLDDLSATHRNQDDVPVTAAYGRALAGAVAALQAHRGPQPPPTTAQIDASLREAQAGLPVMLAAMAEGFNADERGTVEAVFDALPAALRRRAEQPAGYGWVHGDLNPGNILAPRTAEGPVLLIDYQPFLEPPPTSGLGLADLAHAMVLWWPSESRRAAAPATLAQWQAERVARGADTTPPEQLRADWALCVAQAFAVPAARCGEPGAVATMRWLWELHLRRALAAWAELPDGLQGTA